jgi:hypothetical protein
MIHYCYEGVPGLVEILNERNPPLNALILEGLQLRKEMAVEAKRNGATWKEERA